MTRRRRKKNTKTVFAKDARRKYVARMTRLKFFMDKKGLKAPDLHRATGVAQSEIWRFVQGKTAPKGRNITQGRAKIFAPYLDCDWKDLLEDNEPINSIRDISVSLVKVVIKGAVQADVWTARQEWPPNGSVEIEIPSVHEYPDVALHACRVRGDSMDRIYPDGTVLVWISLIEIGETPQSGRRYIVQRTRNDGSEYEVTVKTYIENDAGHWLVAESNNPEWQGAIRYTNGENSDVQIIGRVVRSIREE